MTPPTLDSVTRSLGQLPSLPAVVMELIQSFDREDIDAHELADKISKDQALAVRVLRVANSSFYGLQGKVASIRDAMVVLGFRNVRALAIAAAVKGSFPELDAGWFDLRAQWLHGIVVAICARNLAGAVGLDSDSAFTAGLLHDIGQVVLATNCTEAYREVFENRARHDCYLIESEREVLGFDHAVVGKALAERWKFAEVIQQAVAGHHDPLAGKTLSLGALVQVADVVAHALDLFGAKHELVPRLSSEIWARMGISWQDLKPRLAEIERQSRGAAPAFTA